MPNENHSFFMLQLGRDHLPDIKDWLFNWPFLLYLLIYYLAYFILSLINGSADFGNILFVFFDLFLRSMGKSPLQDNLLP